MRLLLDTHVLAWWVFSDSRLPRSIRDLITTSAEVAVSSVSAFELATKYRLGKWPEARPLVEGFERLAEAESFSVLGLQAHHSIFAGLIASEHRDPFDRLIAAQASIEGMRLVSGDNAMKLLGVEAVWA